MSENPSAAGEPRGRRFGEYEDPHYHDEDEISPVPADEGEDARMRPPAQRKPRRIPPPRRRHYED